MTKGLNMKPQPATLHLSCAGMNRPNLGLNAVAGMLGLTWFF
jgi:hypothetical protein